MVFPSDEFGFTTYECYELVMTYMYICTDDEEMIWLLTYMCDFNLLYGRLYDNF